MTQALPLLAWITLTFTLLFPMLYNHYERYGPFLSWKCSFFKYDCPESVPISGTVDPAYAEVESIFRNNFLNGLDVGGGVAAYVNNKLVVNLQGGWQNVEERIPFTNETISIAYSSTKMLSAIIMAQFVQKGLISYDERIATYWPEFAQGNKENVTVGDLMQHSAGVSYLDSKLSVEDALDPETFSAILARQPHNFNGVRKRAYHIMTLGWYENEILKRVDSKHRTVGDLAKTLEPLYGIEWNLKPNESSVEKRIAKSYRASYIYQAIGLFKILRHPKKNSFVFEVLNKNSIAYKSLINSAPDQRPNDLARPQMHHIEGPSYSGYTNAHSIAKLAAMMANKGKAIVLGEPDLLDIETYNTAMQPVPLDYDHITKRHEPILNGGFGIADQYVIHNVTFVGWCGAGGSVFYWNADYRIGFGYVSNAMPSFSSPDERSLSMLEAIVRIAQTKAH